MGKAIKGIATSLISLVILLLSATPVMAADPTLPGTFQVVSAKACRNVVVSGDAVIAFIYHISDESYSQDVNQLFQFRLFGTDGTTLLGSVSPFAYSDAGFGMGFSAFYFSANGPTWNSGIIINISGSPQYWEDPPSLNYQMSAAEYTSSTDQDDNQAALATYLVGAASTIELQWGVQLVEQSGDFTILTTIGATYATGTIPGIRNMAPGMFASQSHPINTDRINWGTTGADAYLNQWPGTWVADVMYSGGNLFGGNVLAFMSVVSMMGVLVLYILANRFWNDTRAVPSMSVVILTSAFMQGGFARGPFFVILACCVVFFIFCLMIRNAN